MTVAFYEPELDEFVAYDVGGAEHFGASAGDAERQAEESNRIIAQHERKQRQLESPVIVTLPVMAEVS